MNIFIFHNDLRLQDNIGFSESIKAGKTIPIFVFTPQQIGKQNQYRSQNAIDVMCGALVRLDAELKKHGSKLHTYYGDTHTVIQKLIKQHDIVAVYSNMNYTPFALERDKLVKQVCNKNKVEFHEFEDFALFPIGSIGTANGVYVKFTPYLEATKKHTPPKPLEYKITNLAKISNSAVKMPGKGNVSRADGLKILKNMSAFKHYDRDRNTLAIPTTELSMYIKFGLVSVREVYYAFKHTNADLLKQLIWREYYMNIVWAYPYILKGKNRNMNERERKMHWKELTPSNKHLFMAWAQAKTGCPIVDACMTQLNTIGYMHNRGRLIAGWYLVKILGFNWVYGERYFATQLRDYDPAQNNGGWQFVAGSQDSYYRGFNYMTQSAKYDPDAIYIKQWLPQLKSIPAKHLHEWENHYEEYPKIKYPKPIITYDKKYKH